MESLVAKPFPPSRIDADSGVGASRGRTLALAVLLVTIVAGLLTLASYSRQQLEQTPVASDEGDPVYLPDTRFLQLASLGYDNALADVLWFRTIDYFGRQFRGSRLYPWLARMCDIVTDLDPRAKHVYQFGGFILPWEAQLPDEGIRLLQKGVAQFPDSWELQYFLGFNLYYFKDDIQAALPHLQKAAEQPGASPFVSHLAAALATQRLGPEAAREFLEGLRDSGSAGGMESVIRERLQEVRLTEEVGQLNHIVDAYRAQSGREPTSLDDLVAAKMLTAVPHDPFGHPYVYDADKREVRSSSGRRGLRMYDSDKRRQVLSGASYKD